MSVINNVISTSMHGLGFVQHIEGEQYLYREGELQIDFEAQSKPIRISEFQEFRIIRISNGDCLVISKEEEAIHKYFKADDDATILHYEPFGRHLTRHSMDYYPAKQYYNFVDFDGHVLLTEDLNEKCHHLGNQILITDRGILTLRNLDDRKLIWELDLTPHSKRAGFPKWLGVSSKFIVVRTDLAFVLIINRETGQIEKKTENGMIWCHIDENSIFIAKQSALYQVDLNNFELKEFTIHQNLILSSASFHDGMFCFVASSDEKGFLGQLDHIGLFDVNKNKLVYLRKEFDIKVTDSFNTQKFFHQFSPIYRKGILSMIDNKENLHNWKVELPE